MAKLSKYFEGPPTKEDQAAADRINANIKKMGRLWMQPEKYKMMTFLYDKLRNRGIDPQAHALPQTPEDLVVRLNIAEADLKPQDRYWSVLEQRLQAWADTVAVTSHTAPTNANRSNKPDAAQKIGITIRSLNRAIEAGKIKCGTDSFIDDAEIAAYRNHAATGQSEGARHVTQRYRETKGG